MNRENAKKKILYFDPEKGIIMPNEKCYLCGRDSGIAEDFHSEIILDDQREVHLHGSLTDKDGKPIAACKDCLASLLFSAADMYHKDALNPDDESSLQH